MQADVQPLRDTMKVRLDRGIEEVVMLRFP